MAFGLVCFFLLLDLSIVRSNSQAPGAKVGPSVSDRGSESCECTHKQGGEEEEGRMVECVGGEK